MALWQLNVLGTATLKGGGKTLIPERRTLAVLTYLALEGPTSRSRLAGLLWPDATEERARNNLSQNQRRLRQATGEPLVIGNDHLRLSAELIVDAAELKVKAFSEELEKVVALSGELLSGLDYDDLPEFTDWLYAEREELMNLSRQALTNLAERSEKAGQYREAIGYAGALLDLDPVAETSHRLLMRLHYLTGDRPTALRAYKRCEETLARELGVEPLPETKELARRIDQGEVRTLVDGRQQSAPLPLEVLRPPVLIGREDAWKRMEEAWEKGQSIYITGDPGVGKTRLAQDFVASKGRGLYLPAQPGYQDVPFAAAASLARTRIDAAPDVVLPEWVRRELSRILPDLTGEEPPPSRGEEDRVRFFQAYFEMVRLTGAGFVASLSDDLQYYDPATVELGSFLMAQRRPPDGNKNIPRYVAVFRRNELLPASQATLDRQVAAGIAILVELEPFDVQTVLSLLNSLQLDSLPSDATPKLAQALFDRTGGNTLFILETLRNLIEANQLGKSLPERLPIADKVDAIVRQRLTRLSLGAQRVVQAAAVLQSDFDLDLIANLLQTDPLELLPAWQELERAQVFRGNRFSHDLLFESALAVISQPVKVLLHRRSAATLAEHDANPARIARHWQAAGDDLKAVPFLRRAAEQAVAELRTDDAVRFFDQAIAILEHKEHFALLKDVVSQRRHLLQS